MANKPEIIAIAERFEPKLRVALLEAFGAMRDRVPEAEILGALEMGGVEGVMGLLSGIEGDLGIFRDHLRDALVESGRMTLSVMPSGAILNSGFKYDLLNPSTVDFTRQYELNTIRLISENTREAVRTSLTRDIISGKNPRDTARAFRSSLGLTPRQEQAVANYRSALEGLDSRALRRKLRDARYDRTVRRAIDSKSRLSAEQIDKMVGRYRERYLRYRSETIARTESLRAATVGQKSAIDQMLSSNALEGSKVLRFWVSTRDKRTRDAHRRISGLNPEGVPLDGYYQTPLGPLKFPRDPNGTAANVVDCRCTERYRLIE